MASRSAEAILFDVDFTLIEPGPAFRAEGYGAFCARYAIDVDMARFDEAVRAAASLLECPGHAYDPEMFVRYTRAIIEGMGGTGERVSACAREVYEAWASFAHFSLYPDVEPSLRALAADGIRIGLVSNAQRPLTGFASHFALDGLIDACVTSAEHGYLKPHPSIFAAVLRQMDVDPACAVMVGDSFRDDVQGAREAGLRGVLVRRAGRGAPLPGESDEELRELGIPVIASLAELRPLL
ncbi:MAG TPA: HAD family hydrolase [Vicinamibacterales bacterium]|jgi:HAD superfamily hydrolase (TIGR01662 family)